MENLHQPSNTAYGVGEIAELRDLILSLGKGLRASRQYPPEHPIPQQFKHIFRDQLARFFEHSDRICLSVTIDGFDAGDETVFRGPTNSDNIAHIMHRNGIRLLEIQPSINANEIDAFFDAFVTCSSQGDEPQDIVNCFWKASFENIRYEVIDSFETGEVSGMFPEFSADQSQHTFAGTRASYIPGSKISWSNSSHAPLAQAEQTHQMMVQAFGEPDKLSTVEQQALAGMISEDRAKNTKREVVDLLIQLCSENSGPQDMRLTAEALQSTFDRLIGDANFLTLCDIIISVRRLLELDEFESHVVKKRLKEFEARCGDSVRLKMVTNILNTKTDVDLSSVESYLSLLGWESLNNLLWMLGELSQYPARKMVCDLLVKKGFEKIDILGSAVYDSRWYVARNVVWVLGEMKTLQAVPFLTKAAKHNEPRVKTEVIKALGKLGGDKAAGVLQTMLRDESEKIRLYAARELGQNHSRAACQGLTDVVREKDFPDSPPAEMRQILEALVTCGSEESLAVCAEILSKTALFNKARLHRFQEAIIAALAYSPRQQATEMLDRLSTDSRNHIAVAARKARSFVNKRREEI